MTSDKQEQANAQNAQLSTGPVTPEGKAVVARNAVKHGIFAKDLVINAGDGREDEMEYHELLDELTKDLSPVGRCLVASGFRQSLVSTTVRRPLGEMKRLSIE